MENRSAYLVVDDNTFFHQVCGTELEYRIPAFILQQ